jgi:hypothetical protein
LVLIVIVGFFPLGTRAPSVLVLSFWRRHHCRISQGHYRPVLDVKKCVSRNDFRADNNADTAACIIATIFPTFSVVAQVRAKSAKLPFDEIKQIYRK